MTPELFLGSIYTVLVIQIHGSPQEFICAKVFCIDTGNMYCMPQGHVMHVPSISEKHLGSGLCIINPRENHANYYY